ncbi:hypothetical protein BC828DRAFT_378701 [Blastocladiella britannica]|nr:hypothetical protein BC828DRAFT_378701 [Blastocladiella britannica]
MAYQPTDHGLVVASQVLPGAATTQEDGMLDDLLSTMEFSDPESETDDEAVPFTLPAYTARVAIDGHFLQPWYQPGLSSESLNAAVAHELETNALGPITIRHAADYFYFEGNPTEAERICRAWIVHATNPIVNELHPSVKRVTGYKEMAETGLRCAYKLRDADLAALHYSLLTNFDGNLAHLLGSYHTYFPVSQPMSATTLDRLTYPVPASFRVTAYPPTLSDLVVSLWTSMGTHTGSDIVVLPELRDVLISASSSGVSVELRAVIRVLAAYVHARVMAALANARLPAANTRAAARLAKLRDHVGSGKLLPGVDDLVGPTTVTVPLTNRGDVTWHLVPFSDPLMQPVHGPSVTSDIMDDWCTQVAAWTWTPLDVPEFTAAPAIAATEDETTMGSSTWSTPEVLAALDGIYRECIRGAHRGECPAAWALGRTGVAEVDDVPRRVIGFVPTADGAANQDEEDHLIEEEEEESSARNL